MREVPINIEQVLGALMGDANWNIPIARPVSRARSFPSEAKPASGSTGRRPKAEDDYPGTVLLICLATVSEDYMPKIRFQANMHGNESLRSGVRFVGLCPADSRLAVIDGKLMIISPDQPPKPLPDGPCEAVPLDK